MSGVETRTPDERLRAATTKLRETAKGATESPWRRASDDDLGDAYPPNFLANWDGEYLRGVAEFGEGDQAERDSRWAALAHPALAEPLAVWLEDTAAWYEATTVYENERLWHHACGGEVDEGCSCFGRALDVAHVINGGAL